MRLHNMHMLLFDYRWNTKYIRLWSTQTDTRANRHRQSKHFVSGRVFFYPKFLLFTGRNIKRSYYASVLRAPTWAQERFSWEHCRARRFAQTPQSHQLQGELGKCTWTICKHMASFDEFGLLLSLCSFDSVKCNSFNSFDKPKRWEILTTKHKCACVSTPWARTRTVPSTSACSFVRKALRLAR